MNVGPQVLAVLSCLTFGALLHAQSASYIFGRVIDPTDAVVPGASVTVVNQETGFRRMIETGPDGTYAVSGLQAGLFKLTVGAVQETITVEGTAPLLTTDDASIGIRIFQDDIRRLPLGGRGVL